MSSSTTTTARPTICGGCSENSPPRTPRPSRYDEERDVRHATSTRTPPPHLVAEINGHHRPAHPGGHRPRRNSGGRRARRLGAEARAHDDAVDEPGPRRQTAAGVPAPAAHPPGLDEPQRHLGLRGHRPRRRTARDVPGADPGPVRRRVRALRHPAPDHRERQALVQADLHRPRELGRPPGETALRGLRLADHGLGQRHRGRGAQGRLRLLRVRHHAAAQRRDEHGRGLRLRPEPDRRPGRRQAAHQRCAAASGRRDLLHGGVRHLADGLAGAGGVRAHHPPRHDAEPGEQHPAGEGADGGRGGPERPDHRLHAAVRSWARRPAR